MRNPESPHLLFFATASGRTEPATVSQGKESRFMGSVGKCTAEQEPRCHLKVYSGGDTPNGIEGALGIRLEDISNCVDAELEAFWAGRSPAARLSARVAA